MGWRSRPARNVMRHMYRTSDLKSGEAQPKENLMTPETLPTAARLLYTVEEAGLLLGVKRTTMYQLMRSGALASVQVGRLRRLRHNDLVAFAASLRPSVDERAA